MQLTYPTLKKRGTIFKICNVQKIFSVARMIVTTSIPHQELFKKIHMFSSKFASEITLTCSKASQSFVPGVPKSKISHHEPGKAGKNHRLKVTYLLKGDMSWFPGGYTYYLLRKPTKNIALENWCLVQSTFLLECVEAQPWRFGR